jgi:hypothetical protein
MRTLLIVLLFNQEAPTTYRRPTNTIATCTPAVVRLPPWHYCTVWPSFQSKETKTAASRLKLYYHSILASNLIATAIMHAEGSVTTPIDGANAGEKDPDLRQRTHFVTVLLGLSDDEIDKAGKAIENHSCPTSPAAAFDQKMSPSQQEGPVFSIALGVENVKQVTELKSRERDPTSMMSCKPGKVSTCREFSSDQTPQKETVNASGDQTMLWSSRPTALTRQLAGAFARQIPAVLSRQLPGAFAEGGSIDRSDVQLQDASYSDTEEASNEVCVPSSFPQNNLPSARLVHQDQEALQQAIPSRQGYDATVSASKSTCGTIERASRGYFLLLLLALLVLATGTTCLSIILSGKEPSKDTPSYVAYTAAPTTKSIESHVLSLLPEATVQLIVNAVINTVDTPQALAYRWLMQDPNLELFSDQRLVLRFVLATLYFATGGSEWVQKTNWLSHEHHECNWYYWDYVEVSFNVTRYGMPPDFALPCHEHGNRTLHIDEDATFRNLWLPKNNLHGSLPLELYLLTDLHSLIVYANHLEGTLATEIGQLTELEILALSSNVSLAVLEHGIIFPSPCLSDYAPPPVFLQSSSNTIRFANQCQGYLHLFQCQSGWGNPV